MEPAPRGTTEAKALLEDRPEVTMDEVLAAVADHYGLSPSDLSRRGEHALARSIAVWLCRHCTTVRLGALSRRLGYARPECIPGIIKRVEAWKDRNPEMKQDLLNLEGMLDSSDQQFVTNPVTIAEKAIIERKKIGLMGSEW